MRIEISYQVEKKLQAYEFIQILIRSGLDKRRPVNDLVRIDEMCNHANLIVTARINNRLIGIARSVTDFGFCTYLSDLAVDKEYQHTGVGKRLIAETQRAAPEATLILLSAPAATSYYPRIGMKQFDACYILKSTDKLLHE